MLLMQLLHRRSGGQDPLRVLPRTSRAEFRTHAAHRLPGPIPRDPLKAAGRTASCELQRLLGKRRGASVLYRRQGHLQAIERSKETKSALRPKIAPLETWLQADAKASP